MKQILPTVNDIRSWALLLKGFEKAHGTGTIELSTDAFHETRLRIDGSMYAMFHVDAVVMEHFWKSAAISTNETSSFNEMSTSTEHIIHLIVYKIKLGWFRQKWASCLCLMFGNNRVDIDGEVFIGAFPLQNSLEELIQIIHNGIDFEELPIFHDSLIESLSVRY